MTHAARCAAAAGIVGERFPATTALSPRRRAQSRERDACFLRVAADVETLSPRAPKGVLDGTYAAELIGADAREARLLRRCAAVTDLLEKLEATGVSLMYPAAAPKLFRLGPSLPPRTVHAVAAAPPRPRRRGLSTP